MIGSTLVTAREAEQFLLGIRETAVAGKAAELVRQFSVMRTLWPPPIDAAGVVGCREPSLILVPQGEVIPDEIEIGLDLQQRWRAWAFHAHVLTADGCSIVRNKNGGQRAF
jgi:hypothetical protein